MIACECCLGIKININIKYIIIFIIYKNLKKIGITINVLKMNINKI